MFIVNSKMLNEIITNVERLYDWDMRPVPFVLCFCTCHPTSAILEMISMAESMIIPSGKTNYNVGRGSGGVSPLKLSTFFNNYTAVILI